MCVKMYLPNYGSFFEVAGSWIHQCDKGNVGIVADVIVDEELEAGHVYHSEVSVIQMVMRVVFFMIRKNIFQHVHEMFSVEVTLNFKTIYH